MTPTKITLEVTAEQYTVTVYAGESILSTRTCVMESMGSSVGSKVGDVYDDIEASEYQDVAEAADDLGMPAFDAARAIRALDPRFADD